MRGIGRSRGPTGRGRTVAAIALLLVLGGGVPGPLVPVASAQGAPPANWERRYTAIVGAWFLERRCGYLGSAERREMEWLSAELTVGYARRAGLRAVRRLQDVALKLIREEGFAGCGANNRRIVREALPWARADVRAATGRTYDSRSSYRDFALGRFTISRAHVRLDRRCNHVPAAEKGALDSLERTVVTALTEAYGAERVTDAIDRADRLSARDKTPCGAATEARLRAAIADLRDLQREFTR